MQGSFYPVSGDGSSGSLNTASLSCDGVSSSAGELQTAITCAPGTNGSAYTSNNLRAGSVALNVTDSQNKVVFARTLVPKTGHESPLDDWNNGANMGPGTYYATSKGSEDAAGAWSLLLACSSSST